MIALTQHLINFFLFYGNFRCSQHLVYFLIFIFQRLTLKMTINTYHLDYCVSFCMVNSQPNITSFIQQFLHFLLQIGSIQSFFFSREIASRLCLYVTRNYLYRSSFLLSCLAFVFPLYTHSLSARPLFKSSFSSIIIILVFIFQNLVCSYFS